MADEPKRKRGRPPLSPEAKVESYKERNKYKNEWHKQTGYAAQKKYREAHPFVYSERKYHDVKVYISRERKDDLKDLAKREGLTVSEMFIRAVEEKYSINLR